MAGHNINGSTLPPNIAVTSSRPDIVIIDNSTRTVYLFELTVCFENQNNFEAANLRKRERYAGLAEDIRARGFKCCNIPFEVGSRGHLTVSNRASLATMHSICKPKTKFSQFMKNISKISLLCSYSIFLSRDDPWTEVPPLTP